MGENSWRQKKLNEIIPLYEPEIPRHFARWNYSESVLDWKNTIDNSIRYFIENRPYAVETHLTEFFNISTFDFDCVVSDGENSNNKILLNPNPNNGNFYIFNNSSEDLIGDFKLTNILGNTVHSETNIFLGKKEKYILIFLICPATLIFLFSKIWTIES